MDKDGQYDDDYNYPVNRDEVIEVGVEAFKRMAGSRSSFNEEEQRAIEESEYDRAYNPKLYQALDLSPRNRLDSLRNLDIPTLVIHGDEDRMIRYMHGVICAKVIPGAKLLTLRGIGHELPLCVIPEVVPVFLGHIGSAA